MIEAWNEGRAKGSCVVLGKDLAAETQICKRLERLSWKTYATNNLSEANDICTRCTVDVGLVRLNADTDPQDKELEAILSTTPNEWVALVDEENLNDPQFCQFLHRLCYAYHTTSCSTEQLACLMQYARDISHLNQTPSPSTDDYEMVGTTETMKTLFDTIRRVASVEAPVFIHGESGTGKELAANAIHERSSRSAGPFIAVNCGAMPSNLIQSELFGHEKGAFTGATARKTGKIEAATGGTLFLDEIGDLPIETQVNLLRFLENQTITPVGDIRERTVDVRIIAATHRDLESAVEEGTFREDLYHRLNVLRVDTPPLRERQDDIEVLANFFFKKFADEKSPALKGFSQESLAVIRHYEWPGNVRELINRVRRAMVMCDKRLIRPIDMGLERRKLPRDSITLEEARDQAERQVLVATLARNRYQISQSAKELGVSRVTLYRLIEKHQLKDFKEDTEKRLQSSSVVS